MNLNSKIRLKTLPDYFLVFFVKQAQISNLYSKCSVQSVIWTLKSTESFFERKSEKHTRLIKLK